MSRRLTRASDISALMSFYQLTQAAVTSTAEPSESKVNYQLSQTNPRDELHHNIVL